MASRERDEYYGGASGGTGRGGSYGGYDTYDPYAAGAGYGPPGGGYGPGRGGGYGGGYGGAAGAAGAYSGGPGGYGGPGGFDAQSPLDAEIQVTSSNKDWLECLFNVNNLFLCRFLIHIYIYIYDALNSGLFNFVGKILGPKGASLQAMAKQYKCHIYVLGRGSTKDRNKEQELLSSGDPQYAHYGGPLHVKVETIAPAHVAYERVSGVLEELSRILQPVREDTTPAHLKEGENGGSGENKDGEADKDKSVGGGFGGRGGRGGMRGGGPMRGGRGGVPGGRGGSEDYDVEKTQLDVLTAVSILLDV
uniref:KH_dom_type_1 domain-containing protein n=1 Tax=Heterorhabditis bacteriophora TaxID=37862 RepID=A0A1I7WRZ8_HETBA